ncbi:MAG: hypothetical protein JWM68_4730 [Verrucomicrobiales bacterium]|nr:hypothetical protein [Verrucomicrobiales bacterium]
MSRAAFAMLVFLGFSFESAQALPASSWTTGIKKVLIIPVRFTDQVGPSDVPNGSGYLSGWGNVTNGTATADINNFFVRQSYGKCSFVFTVLPEINMGVSYTNYNGVYPPTTIPKYTAWSEPGSFADDVRAKARQAGVTAGNSALYDTDNYDLDIVAAGFIPGQGTIGSGLSHGKGIFATTFKALSHEICHNLGLSHANGMSRASFYSPLKNNTFYFDAYGDVFDLMGFKDTAPIPLPPDREVNVFWKNMLGWLPDAQIINDTNSGTYRLYAFDQGSIEAGKYYGMKIVRDASRTYWLDFRQAITNADAVWSQNGLEVHFGGESIAATAGQTSLLDMTPGSRGLSGTSYATMHDAPLAIGRTYSDAEANLHITPIKKGGTTPESLDVVVNHGPFPSNAAPALFITPTNVTLNAGVLQTFTATASDPDADTLAYYWEFDDPAEQGGSKSGGTNPDSRLSTQGSHAWTRNGDYFVRCTVTDMKGHTTITSAKVTITNGVAGILTISGVVKDDHGIPLAGAVVNNFKATNPVVLYGATNFAASGETGSDGKYMVQLPAIGAATYNLSVLYQGYSFSCSVNGGAIAITSSSVTNVDFTLLRATRTISGAVVVAGRSYEPTTDGPLTVTTGAQTVSATSGSWQMTVTDGSLVNLTATPSNATYTVLNYFPNPYFVANDFNLLHFDVKIPGRMPEVGFTTNSARSDDTVGTINIPVTMTLPAGSNTWVADQAVYYWIDGSGTAEYGVDYKMSGGAFTFYGSTVPTTKLIPLKIIHNSVPKNKTVVIKVGPASSIVNMGPINTFTYTISNAPPQITGVAVTNGNFNLSWFGAAAARYTIQSTPSLSPIAWTNRSPHTNMTGVDGTMTRSIAVGASSEFFRVKTE